MPFASHQGIKIYYEVEGHGPPIVLAHGLTGNLSFWTGYGYVDKLKDRYSVILFDARGHGQSDKPHETERYDYRLRVGDVIAVLDTLGVTKTHYWGYSMGGYIGFGVAKHFPERLSSLVTGGSNPYAASDTTAVDVMLRIFRRGVQEGVEAVVTGMREWAGSITPQYEARLRGLDLQAMVAHLEYSRYQRPGLENDVLQIELPCLFYAGEADEGAHAYGQEAVQHMPNARYFSLPGLNHVGASSAAEQIMPQVLSFLYGLPPPFASKSPL